MSNEKIALLPGPLFIIAFATFLALVVFTAPLTTLDAMTETHALSASGQAWVMSGMPLGAACGLLTAGALGDTLGRRAVFVGGLWLTVLSSIGAAFAPNGLILILMRIIQGLGSAGLMACGLGLLGQIHTGQARQQAAGIWAASLGGGVAAGPILASLAMMTAGWPTIHILIAIISAILALAAQSRLPESPRKEEPVDLLGSLLLIIGLGCLLSALTEVRFGLTPLVWSLLCVGLVLLAVFFVLEKRLSNPILQVELFARTDFSGATLAAFASGAGVLALMSMVPTVLVRGNDVAPMMTSVILLAWSGVTVFSAIGANYLPAGLTPRNRVILAIFGCAVGQLLLLVINPGTSWLWVLPGLFIAGIANGVLNASLGHAAVESVPDDRSAMGSAANNTARYLGSALGIALISILIANTGGETLFLRWHEAVLATTAFSIVGAIAMILMARRRTRLSGS
ncbi:MFS transporter [Ponticaulis profundi]|uniref:MFS transporter n=1 Tax=Ponticaulis profundi TaxID=2665222 RepID=A0ABW1SAR5_9PROT